MRKVLVLHGPNLNLLGEREPDIYGTITLKEVNHQLRRKAQELRIQLKIFQSNHEGTIIDLIHKYRKWADGIVINPGAYTHTSYGIRDAIVAVGKPTVEVHISDIYKREPFRRVSVLEDVCLKQITGKGVGSYLEALEEMSVQGNKGTEYKVKVE
jgi:3-dehydroquinate dehydratase-2